MSRVAWGGAAAVLMVAGMWLNTPVTALTTVLSTPLLIAAGFIIGGRVMR